jgi:ABC-type polysaccharide/polyol phosphate transport system ATPase subunit
VANLGGDAVTAPPALEARDVKLAYRLARNAPSTVAEMAIAALRRQVRYERLWALDGISFTVRAGELMAVIGPNGAGKTTLLKVMARVLPPTSGRVIVRGLVAPIIELGAGFSAELTGLENAIIYGALLGHDPRWLRAKADEIAAYAGLEGFMDVPVRAYSSGMVGRLAFAVATLGSPEVLLVDEVLAVGDESFRLRSAAKIEELMSEGTAVLLVTHGLDVARERADRVLWIDHGREVLSGDPVEVVDAYSNSVVPDLV